MSEGVGLFGKIYARMAAAVEQLHNIDGGDGNAEPGVLPTVVGSGQPGESVVDVEAGGQPPAATEPEAVVEYESDDELGSTSDDDGDAAREPRPGSAPSQRLRLPRVNWTDYVAGCPASGADIAGYVVAHTCADAAGATIVNNARRESFGGGRVHAALLDDMRPRGPGRRPDTVELHVYAAGDESGATAHRLSMATAQCTPRNSGAMFQIETGPDTLPVRPDGMNAVDALAWCPDECIATAAATVLRAAAVMLPDATTTAGLRMWDAVAPGTGGPRRWSGPFPVLSAHDFDGRMGTFPAVYQTNCQVIFEPCSDGQGGSLALAPPRQTADLVFAPRPTTRADRPFLLTAAYAAAYLAAIRERKAHLFLRVLGPDVAAALAVISAVHASHGHAETSVLQRVTVLSPAMGPAADAALWNRQGPYPVTKHLVIEGTDHVAFAIDAGHVRAAKC